MFYYLSLPFVSLLDFFDRGGPVIFILFLVAIIMITLLVERLIFFINDLKKLSADRVLEVQECPSDNKWIRNKIKLKNISILNSCLLYTSPSPRDRTRSRMPSSA